MRMISVKDYKGVTIHEGTVNQREIRLFASPDCIIQRTDFALGMSVVPPGKIHEEHAHSDNEELMFVYQGTGKGTVGGENITIKPGDMIAVEKGEPHSFVNTGDEELCILWVYSPPGSEKKFLNEEQFADYEKNDELK